MQQSEIQELQDEIAIKEFRYQILLEKALNKRKGIVSSQCYEYTIPLGYFARQRDLLNIEAVIVRLRKRILYLQNKFENLNCQ